MRLIDAEKYPCKDCDTKYCNSNCDKFNDWLNTPIRYDIVYCKDCAYWDDKHEKCPMCSWQDDEEFGMETLVNNAKPDWFCSEGRRK